MEKVIHIFLVYEFFDIGPCMLKLDVGLGSLNVWARDGLDHTGFSICVLWYFSLKISLNINLLSILRFIPINISNVSVLDLNSFNVFDQYLWRYEW